MKRMGLASIACAAALTVACNTNARGTDTRTDNQRAEQNAPAVATTGNADERVVHDSDRDFINHQLADGTAEVELARLASTHAASPDVKRFATMMVQDHTKAGNELKQVASQYNVTTTPTIDEKHQDVMNRLSKLNGASFDREYIKAMIDDHENAVDSLESRVDSSASLKEKITHPREAKEAPPVAEPSDNAIKASVNAWAASTLPTIRRHLDEAKSIHDRLEKTNETARNDTHRTGK